MFSITSRGLRRTFAVLGGCALLGVVVGATFEFSRRNTRRQQSTTSVPSVESKTSALQVLESKKVAFGNASLLLVKVQNVSGKDIKALSIGIGKTFMTRNFFLSEESIAAGAIVTERISLPSKVEQEGSKGSESDRAIILTAVCYSDGTGDGDPRYVQLLKNQAAGMRDQARRILPTLRRLSTSGNQQEQALTDLESEGSGLPTTGEGRVSPDYEEGLRNARKVLLGRVREIKEQRRSNDFEGALNKQSKMIRVFESLAQSSLPGIKN